MHKRNVLATIALTGACLVALAAGNTHIYEADELTVDMLCDRKGIVIEHIVGVVANEEMDGMIANYADPEYCYISYKGVDAEEGDWIDTYCVYNPMNQYEDDIILRLDFVRGADKSFLAPEKTTDNCLTEVVQVGENDLVTAISVDGHIWEFYADEIEVGDEVDLIIDHNNTNEPYDDVVVDYII